MVREARKQILVAQPNQVSSNKRKIIKRKIKGMRVPQGAHVLATLLFHMVMNTDMERT